MLSNHLILALRNVRKRPTFALIHVVGLSLGLMSSLLIFLFVYFHLSTNTFYPDFHRIYRVVLDMHVSDGSIEYESGTSVPMAQALKDEYAAIEQVGFCMPFYRTPQLAIPTTTGEPRRFLEDNGVAYADQGFLMMFGHRLVEGSSATALANPNQVVITERQASKYFGEGSGSVLGKTIRMNNQTDLVVSGVVEDYPKNTDFAIDVWVSMPTLKVMKPSYQTENFSWIGSNNWTFVKLSRHSDALSINAQLSGFVSKYLGDEFAHWQFHLQPLSDMHFDTRYGGTLRKPLLHLLSTVALFIILIACINFVNLSTAQALSRAKEVGVRKVLGSSRPQLFWQFMTETSLLVVMALGGVMLGAQWAVPGLNDWIQTQLSLQPLSTPLVVVGTVAFVLSIILLAGSYPAFVLAGFHPIRALQNRVGRLTTSGYRLRQLLLAFQFTVAQVLIIGAVVVLYQLDYVQQYNVGFQKEAIVTVEVPRRDYSQLDAFRNQLKQYPDIEHVSFHLDAPMTTTNEGGYVRFNGRSESEPFLVRDRWADEDYLETYDLRLVAGRNFTLRDSTTEFLVNEAFVEHLGVASPEEVLGKPLYEGNAEVSGVIVGVVKDFHHRSLQNPIEPLVIYPFPRLFTQAGIRLQSGNLSRTLPTIQKTWEAAFPDQVFTYRFLEDTVAQSYEKEQRIAKLIRLFTLVSVLICCLGLIGLAMYAAQRRTKEIGIRKVLGASVPGILLLLSREFLVLVLLGFVLSAPVAYYFLRDWLNTFAYRISIQWWMFAVSGVAVLLITLGIVGRQSLRAARSNPVDSLRNE